LKCNEQPKTNTFATIHFVECSGQESSGGAYEDKRQLGNVYKLSDVYNKVTVYGYFNSLPQHLLLTLNPLIKRYFVRINFPVKAVYTLV